MIVNPGLAKWFEECPCGKVREGDNSRFTYIQVDKFFRVSHCTCDCGIVTTISEQKDIGVIDRWVEMKVTFFSVGPKE